MRCRHLIRLIPALLLCVPVVEAAEDIASSQTGSDWQFFGAAVFGPRDIEGDILINRGIGSGYATADSLGLGTARAFQFRLGARYKRWRVSLDYLPTNYTGEGFAVAEIDIPPIPPISTDTPVSSDIDVKITLINANYEFVQNEKWIASVGLGFGRTTLDIALVPEIGEGIVVDSNTPFGYIAGDLRRRWGRWSAQVAIQWISGDFGGFDMDYGNYNLSAGYLFPFDSSALEVLAGYRRIDFKFDYSIEGRTMIADFRMSGPYAGVAYTF